MNPSDRYLVAGCRPWNRVLFETKMASWPGTWRFVGARDDLTPDLVRRWDPRFIFLLHWSWLLPREIWEGWECIGFHMGNLPRDRGGSPLQNLILEGRKSTRLNAFRIVKELDAGPIYLYRDLSLDGSAEEIYRRAGELSGDMIRQIVDRRPEPVPQAGTPSYFRRRRPEESHVPAGLSLEEMFDFIRMLDAEGYPRAYLEAGGFRFTLSEATLEGGHLKAQVAISRPEGQE